MEEWRWRDLGGDSTEVQLEELHPFTQYLVSLQVCRLTIGLSLSRATKTLPEIFYPPKFAQLRNF